MAGNKVYAIWAVTGGIIKGKLYDFGWGSETTLQSDMSQYSTPVLSFSSTNNDLYCFWQSAPEYNNIYYRRYHDRSWGSVVDLINETEAGFTRNDAIMCLCQDYGNEICVIYEIKTSNPYDLKFCSLNIPEILGDIDGDGDIDVDDFLIFAAGFYESHS